MTFAQRSALCLLILGLAAPLALAGPNAGGVLVVHDIGIGYTVDTSSYPSTPPADCHAVDNELPAGVPPAGTAGFVWKVYAAFPTGSSPRLKAVPLGESFPAEVVVVTGGLPDPAADFEIPQGGWPTTSGGGDGISFGQVKTDLVDEVYWFAGYGYSGTFDMVNHPTQTDIVFVDDEVPPNQDLIRGMGKIGFGQPGFTPCPEIPVVRGACCFADGTCQADVEESTCGTQGGTFQGEGTVCDPNPCPQPQGACCLPNGSCQLYTEVQCNFFNGTWLGAGVACNVDTCPLGWACCKGGTCEILTLEACNAAPIGVWAEGFLCDQVDPATCQVSPTEESSWGRIKQHYGR